MCPHTRTKDFMRRSDANLLHRRRVSDLAAEQMEIVKQGGYADPLAGHRDPVLQIVQQKGVSVSEMVDVHELMFGCGRVTYVRHRV